MGGGDKSLRLLGDKPLMSHVIERLGEQVDEIVINANGDRERLAHFKLPVIADSIDDFAGPLAGILAGMDYAARHGFSHIVVVAADTPFFPMDLMQRLSENAQKINIARDDNAVEKFALHPTFGLWDVGLRDELRTALQNDMRKVMGFVKQYQWRAVQWVADGFDPFFNVNTPDDMAQADLILQGMNT